MNCSVEPFSVLLRRFREDLGGVAVLLAIGFSYRVVMDAIRGRLGAGIVLISVSPTASGDIWRVSGAEPRAVEVDNAALKMVGRNIILCEQKFGPATYDMVRDAREAAYGLAGRTRRGVRDAA